MMAGFTLASVVSPATIEAKHGRVHREGVSGAAADFVCFHCPLVASAEAKAPALREKPFTIGKNSYSVAPIWRDNMQVVGRAAWGRVCGRAKLLAGTLRCLHLCWRLPWDWSDAEQLGRCPKPHKGRCPLTLQGGFPLDPFLAPRLERASHAVPCRGFLPFSPLPYWNKDIISCGDSPPTMDSPGLISWSNSAFFRCPSATTCSSIEACVTRRITSTLRVCPMRYARSVA